MREDWLLQRFSAKGSEAAFAELVRRHLDFVYSVCRRKVGDPELAQDITQTVFLLLAAKSGSLKPGTVLSGWLFQTAHHACQNALRTEARRRHYERKAAEEMEHSVPLAAGINSEGPQWEPVLDDALAQLSAADRNAVLLRYVEELSPEEIGVALGISAAAAQKRVSRALERLRRRFAHAGTALSVAALGLLLTEHLVQAAPVSASAAILAAVKSSYSAAAAGTLASTLGSGTALAQWSRPAPLVKAPVLAAAVLLGGVLLGSVLLHGKTAPTKAGSAGAAPLPQAIIAVSGSVMNSDGSPAPGVAVRVLRSAVPDGAESLFAEARTDGQGRYRVSGPGSALDGWSVTADSGSRLGIGVPGRVCVLLPPTRLRLHLTGEAGQPLPGVAVQPLLLTRTNAAGRIETASLLLGCPKRLLVRSDRFGNAIFAGLPQGCGVSFAVLDPGFERRPPSADGLTLAAQADSGTQAVPVLRGASVAGRLVYAGSGLPAAGVRIGAQEARTAAWGEAQTDSEGRYAIRQLSPGRYTVAVDEESGPLESQWTAAAVPGVTLGPGQTVTGAEMKLVQGTLITGTVTAQNSGRPVAGTEVGAYGPAHPATGAWVSGGWTGADGTYQIRVPPGAQQVYPMAFPGAGKANITARNGQTAVVDFAVPAP